MAGAESILVLGHRGLLGRAVLAACGEAGEVIPGGREAFDLALAAGYRREAGRPRAEGETVGPDQAEASLTWVRGELLGGRVDPARVHAGLNLVRRAILAARSPVVINCAGYTAVDRAEAEPAAALAVNGAGAEAVARACAEAGKHLVHLSTDYVFDGGKDGPYREDDPPNPLSAYGRSKLLGERLVRAALPGALVVRSAWLFGNGRPHFVSRVVAQARDGGEVAVVGDQVGSPTYVRDLARALVQLGRRRVGGVLHVVNQGQASRLELARCALELAGLDPGLAREVTSREFHSAARRPARAVLNGGRAARLLGGPLPTWLDALKRYFREDGEALT